MDLKKYERIFETMRDWDNEGQRYGFEILFETLQEPGHIKMATAKRITGASLFKEKMQRFFENKDIATVTVKIHSGVNNRAKTLSIETLRINQAPNVPIINYNVPEKKTALPQTTYISSNQQVVPEPSHNTANNGLDGSGLLLGVLGVEIPQGGLNGPNGAETLQSMLTFRDNIIATKLSISEKDKEIAELKAKNTELLRLSEEKDKAINTLNSNFEKLENNLLDLQDENDKLMKLKPENSLLGISLTGLGSAILEKAAINIIKSRPKLVGGLLGVDSETVLGLLNVEQTNETTPNAHQHDDVEINPLTGTPERKQELQAVANISKWLKTLDRNNLARVEQLCSLWAQDNELIEIHYNWATGTHTSKIGTTEQEQEHVTTTED